MAKASFKYQRRSTDTLKERANMRGGDFDSFIKDGIKMFTPKEGKNIIRILPPTWENPKHYGYDLYIYYGVGSDNSSYLSLKKMLNKPDPLDEARAEAEKDGDKKLAKALRPKQRVGMWVIDRSDEGVGPQFWAAPFTLDKDFANVSMDEDSGEVFYIDDPDKGNDIRFYREGTKLTTKYPASKIKVLPESSLAEDDRDYEDWMNYIQDNPIPDVLNFFSYDDLSKAFNGVIRLPEDEGDEKDDRRGRGRDRDDRDRPSSRSRGGSRDDDEDRDRERDRDRPSSRSRDQELPFDPDEEKDEKTERTERRSRSRDPDPEPAPEEKPSRARRSRDPDPETEPEPETRRARSRDKDPEPEPKEEKEQEVGSGSIRERLRRNRDSSKS